MKNKKTKKKRIIIKLQSTKTSNFYSTIKKINTKKLKLKKYDPKIRCHIEYKEKKIK